MSRYKIIYVYDALCSWCYAFSPVIKGLFDNYKDRLDFEVLSGGMVLEDRSFIGLDKSLYQNIETISGISFGPAFLNHLENNLFTFNSLKAASALAAFKSILPEKAIDFAHDIQQSIYYDGKNPKENELYRYLAVNFGIDPDEFEAKINSDEFFETAKYEFALAKQLQVEGYPAVLLQQNESKFYLLAKGFTDYETLELRLNNVIQEIEASGSEN